LKLFLAPALNYYLELYKRSYIKNSAAKIKTVNSKQNVMKTSSSIEVISKIDIPEKAIEKYINTNVNRLKTKTNRDTFFNAFSHPFEKIDCCSAYVDVKEQWKYVLEMEDQIISDL